MIYSAADNHSRISVYVNDKPFIASSGWLDSLTSHPENIFIRYKITGAHSNGVSVTTRIILPQVLTIKEVVRQIILYYEMLDDDEERRNEKLLIYPYFTEVKNPPHIRVRFSDERTIYVEVRDWQTVSRPPAPGPEERDIYNQIIDDSFSEVQEYENIPEETFRKIARKNNIPMSRVIQIYKNVILWQLTR